MAESRELQLILTLKDQASKELQKVNGFIQNNASAIRSAGVAMTAVGGGMTFLTKSFVDAAAGFEQSRIAFETMLGSASKADKLLKDLTDFAAKTPFELTGLQDSTKQLLAYGFAQEEIIPNLKALGDIASGVGMDKLPNLILAFGQVKAATRLTGMELRQFTEAGVPLLDALSKQLKKPVSDIQEMVSAGEIGFPMVQKALMDLTGEGGRFNNMMDKQSKTFSGMISNMKDAIGIFLKEGGRPLIDTLKGIVSRVIELLGKMNEWTKAHPQLTKVISVVVAVLGGLLLVIGPILIALPSLVAAFGVLSTMAVALGISVIALVGIFALIAVAIAGAIVVGYLIVKNWDWIKSKALEIWGVISNFIIGVWEKIVGFLSGVWQKISDMAINTWTNISNFVISVWDNVTSAFQTVWDGIANFFQGVWDVIANIFKFGAALAVGLVIEGFSLLGIDIVGVMEAVKGGLQTFWDGAVGLFQTGISKVQEAWNWMGDGLKTVNDTTMEYLNYSTQSNLGTLTTIYQTSLTFLQSVWNTVWGAMSAFLGPVWSVIQGIISVGWNWISNIFKTATKPIQDAWKGMWDGIKSTFDVVWAGIQSGIKSGINSMIDMINSVIRSFNSVALKGAGALKISIPTIPEIPRLAKGGIVTSPTVAMIGEAGPEAVVPLKKSGGFGNITINISGNQLLSEDAGETITKQIMDALRLNMRLAI